MPVACIKYALVFSIKQSITMFFSAAKLHVFCIVHALFFFITLSLNQISQNLVFCIIPTLVWVTFLGLDMLLLMFHTHITLLYGMFLCIHLGLRDFFRFGQVFADIPH